MIVLEQLNGEKKGRREERRAEAKTPRGSNTSSSITQTHRHHHRHHHPTRRTSSRSRVAEAEQQKQRGQPKKSSRVFFPTLHLSRKRASWGATGRAHRNMMQAHGRVASRWGAPMAPRGVRAGRPAVTPFSSSSSPSKRRPSSSFLARAEGDAKKGETAAVAVPSPPATPPPADKSHAREGLNYVAHSYGTGRLSSDDEDGARRFFCFLFFD